jgi:hypothetical protein
MDPLPERRFETGFGVWTFCGLALVLHLIPELD